MTKQILWQRQRAKKIIDRDQIPTSNHATVALGCEAASSFAVIGVAPLSPLLRRRMLGSVTRASGCRDGPNSTRLHNRTPIGLTIAIIRSIESVNVRCCAVCDSFREPTDRSKSDRRQGSGRRFLAMLKVSDGARRCLTPCNCNPLL